MRKALALLAVLVATALVGQTDGLTYQAVIIDNNPQEIPGVDITGNVLSEGEVWLRFTIINQEATEYQEVHQTTTDRYGMVSLVIGGGEMLSSSPLLFTEIDWNGTPRQLAVELAFTPDEFDAFTVEELYFVPYAYHRNITATGTLIVDGNSTLHSDLQVGGNTNIDGTLSVWGATEINNSLDVTGGNPTNLSGNVTIGGDVQVDGSSNFDGPSTFNTITVLNHSQLNGTLDVDGAADFAQNVAIGGGLSVSDVANFGDEVNIDSTLVVHDDAFVEQNFTALGSSMLRGQVTINPSWAWGEDDDYGAYALRVEGTHQGVAVSLGGTAQEGRNFMLFLDGEQNIKGGIEGQTNGDLITSWRFIFDTAMLALQTGFATAEAIACSANIPPDAGEVFVNTGLAIALGVQTGEYAAMNNLNVGVAYISGSADYAEWLERMDVNEVFKPGEVVGVYAGQISHKTEGADHLLVISTAPAVLGNMPDEGQEDLFEKVAFLGQVPVLVAGSVQEGDYIVASGNTDGYAQAYAPDDLATADFDQIIGVAWESGHSTMANVVNVAIGLGSNQLASRVAAVENELDILKRQVAALSAGEAEGASEHVYPHTSNTVDQDKVNAATQAYMKRQQNAALGNVDVEAWLEAVAPAIEQEMASLRAFYQEAGIDYSQHTDLALLIDHPTEALRRMHEGDFLPTLWQGIRP